MAPIEEKFCEIDDFCKAFFPQFERVLLPASNAKRKHAVSMSASEIIVILFHLSHYRDFKNFYLYCVIGQMGGYFPSPLSYNRFVEVQGRTFPALCTFMKVKSGHQTGLYLSIARQSRPVAISTGLLRGLASVAGHPWAGFMAFNCM